MLRTRFTERFAIEHPLMQGGMQWVGRAELAAAVSNIGPFGCATALTQPTPENVSRAIARCRELTDRPFAVNHTILPTISAPPYAECRQAIVDGRLKIIGTAGSNPEEYPDDFTAAGVKITHDATSVRHLRAEALGVDAVSIDDFECAGHPGEDDVPGLILVAVAADWLSIPMIASGGIADARGLVAALALGADGVNVGTRRMCTVESPIHRRIKEEIVANDERSTQFLFKSLRITARVAKHSVSDEARRMLDEGGSFEDVRAGGEPKGRDGLPERRFRGRFWRASQAERRIHDIPTCAKPVERVVSGAKRLIAGRLVDACEVAS